MDDGNALMIGLSLVTLVAPNAVGTTRTIAAHKHFIETGTPTPKRADGRGTVSVSVALPLDHSAATVQVLQFNKTTESPTRILPSDLMVP